MCNCIWRLPGSTAARESASLTLHLQQVPRGSVIKGANAQDEEICRCSTLYACIFDRSITSRFHDRHLQGLKEERLTALYNDVFKKVLNPVCK